MRAVFVTGLLAISACGLGGGILKDLPRDQCQSVLDEVRAKANRPPRFASRYGGNWVFAGGTAGGSPIRIAQARGKVLLQVLAQPEVGMTSSDQQGVVSEYVGSSDDQGLYLYLNGRPSDGSLRLRLYDNSKLEGTITDTSCKGTNYVLFRN